MTSGLDDYLSVLDRRADLLDALVDGPTEKRELVEVLGVSRSTIDRAVRELEGGDLVERRNGAVALTFLGRLSYASYVRYRREVVTVERFADVLRHLDASAPLPPMVLDGAEIYRPDPPATHRPYTIGWEALENATEVKGLARAVTNRESPDRFHEALFGGGLELELVGTSAMIDHLRETRAAELAQVIQDGALSLYRYDDVPFGLFVFDPGSPDGSVIVLVYDETDQVAGMIRNRRGYVVDWGVAFVRRIRETAEPVGHSLD